jgi:two-component system, cell cycle sensor histidine kinase and response regulator CckA
MKMNRVLIVDDEEENLYLLRALLQGNGYEVASAIHGAEALQSARQHPPDLIITDILMPVMDGFTLCREWKKDTRLKSIPFVFYTATYTGDLDRKFALDLGAEQFIVKPEEPDAFMAIIRETIQKVGSPPVAREHPATKRVRLPVEAPEEQETVYLKQYNQTLIRKLEAKMEQLEQANREMGKDIAKHKRVEAEQGRLAAIVNFSDDAIIGKTMDGIITSWNHGAEKIFGYSAAEAVGRPMLMLFPPDRLNEEKELLVRIGRGESVAFFETVRVCKDGKHIDVSVTLSPITDGGGRIVGASNIARDITGRKQLEAQLRQAQKMEAVGRLAGGVAHDFNNILAVIQMQVDLLKTDGIPSPSQLESLNDIGAAAERATALTRQLLLFSRKEIMQPRDLDLNESINNMSKMLRRILGEDIHTHFKFSLQPLFIRADPGMMDQVLMNLAVNSRDAMPGGGQLAIETSAVEFDELAAAQSPPARPGSFVCLRVSDTGCGISPENLPRIFEPFFTTKDVGKGTGLGLAVIHGIVQQHQGWIHVDSEAGRGTTFRIFLPCLPEIPAAKSALPVTTAMRGGHETILLVEDDPFVRASLHGTLSQLGYRVVVAVNGVEALEVWKQHGDEIQLVLTDLVMPGGMNGKELCERLLKDNPKLRVIYTSGYSTAVAGKDLLLKEDVNFLAKPFQARKLAQTIRTRLDG